MADHMNEIVSRSAPRWAWELIDETLAMDAKSKAFSADLRGQISAATYAMGLACEEASERPISMDEATKVAEIGKTVTERIKRAAKELDDLSDDVQLAAKKVNEKAQELSEIITYLIMLEGSEVLNELKTWQGEDQKAALGQLLEQVYQMQGMFPDEDGSIARAVADAEEALA